MHIELGQVADRLGDANGGIGFCLIAGCLVVLLAADGSLGEQVRGPLVFRGQALEVGLRLDDVGLGTSQLGLVRTGIDLKQHVPLFDVGSFLEQHLLQVTADPGPHVDRAARALACVVERRVGLTEVDEAEESTAAVEPLQQEPDLRVRVGAGEREVLEAPRQ